MLGLSRRELRLTIGLLSRICPVNYHTKHMVKVAMDASRYCLLYRETTEHLLCVCESLTYKRLIYLIVVSVYLQNWFSFICFCVRFIILLYINIYLWYLCIYVCIFYVSFNRLIHTPCPLSVILVLYFVSLFNLFVFKHFVFIIYCFIYLFILLLLEYLCYCYCHYYYLLLLLLMFLLILYVYLFCYMFFIFKLIYMWVCVYI